MKKIDFVMQPGGGRRLLVPMVVQLDTLSPTARRLAEIVHTLDKRDDLSVVRVQTARTEREINLAAGMPAARVEQLATVWGVNLDVPRVVSYAWDALRSNRGVPGETGEQYFERHARSIESQGLQILA